MTANRSGLSPWGDPYTDTGTGAFDGPPAEVTHTADASNEPTGAVDGPPASVTTESPPEHLAKPTGTHPGPPASVTAYQWPASSPDEAVQEAPVQDAPVAAGRLTVTDKIADTKAVQDAENKAVTAKAGTERKGAD